jgi:hypothetical protein
VRRLTKRPLLLVLAVLVLLDIASVQMVLSRDKDHTPAPAATATHAAPGVVPVTVAPPGAQSGDTPSPTPTPSSEPTDTPTPTPSPSPEADNPPDSSTGSQPAIRINGGSFAARPFETVGIEGTYSGTSAQTMLRVQHRQGGDWVDFPLPTATDGSGNFTAYVELGDTGRHEIRVLDPRSHVASSPVSIVIR